MFRWRLGLLGIILNSIIFYQYMFLQSDLEVMNAIFSNPSVTSVFILLGVWSLIWKGIALWKAARNSQKKWFIAMLMINSVGILEIVYIFYFSKKTGSQEPQAS